MFLHIFSNSQVRCFCISFLTHGWDILHIFICIHIPFSDHGCLWKSHGKHDRIHLTSNKTFYLFSLQHFWIKEKKFYGQTFPSAYCKVYTYVCMYILLGTANWRGIHSYTYRTGGCKGEKWPAFKCSPIYLYVHIWPWWNWLTVSCLQEVGHYLQ